MSTFSYKLIISLLAILSVGELRSQTILFDHMQLEDGLSERSVQAIYQDELNRIWIATRDGLNLYDGRSMEVFRPVLGDTTSIIGHNVQNVTGNRQGQVYIHCMAGILTYDMKKEKLSVVEGAGIERISLGQKHLWASFRNKLYYLDDKTNKLVLYHTFEEEVNITSIFELANNELYIGTRDHGLMLMHKDKSVTNVISAINIICTFQDSLNKIWFGTLKNGLFCIDEQNQIKNYKHNPHDRNSISNDFVRCINEDNAGNIWVGTFKGLNKLDISQQQFTHFLHGQQRRHSIGSNSVWCITKDKQGSLWIGSFYGGVDVFNPDYLYYNYYTTGYNDQGLCDGVVGSIAEDPEGNMWICSENTGLNFFDRKKNTFKWYYNEDIGISETVNASLKDIYYDDSRNCIWIGTHLSGLHKMNMANKQISRINFTDKASGNDYVRRIIPYGDKLLLGTHNSVYVLDKNTLMAEPLLDNIKLGLTDRQIWDLFIDSKKRLWFSTSSEVYCYTLETEELSVFKYIPNKDNSL